MTPKRQTHTVQKWVAKQKRNGHEVQYTPNGHPYAVLKRVTSVKKKLH